MMEREQCGVRCHLRGFDTGFFCRNRLYRRSYNEKMNVLMLNGSPNPNVNTSIVLREMENVFRDIYGCVGCFTTGKCVFTDIANELVPKFKAA